MWFLALGLIGLALKYFEIGPIGQLSWWIVLIPFGLSLNSSNHRIAPATHSKSRT